MDSILFLVRDKVGLFIRILDETEKFDTARRMILTFPRPDDPASKLESLEMNLGVHEVLEEVGAHQEEVVDHQAVADALPSQKTTVGFQQLGEDVDGIALS